MKNKNANILREMEVDITNNQRTKLSPQRIVICGVSSFHKRGKISLVPPQH